MDCFNPQQPLREREEYYATHGDPFSLIRKEISLNENSVIKVKLESYESLQFFLLCIRLHFNK